ncbi:hypothetical protein HYW42_05575 [Candidatus Daviesbacteria bacterium]|nr:hypothetical protein [Candidatus Daviesbacteria bacterium]
MKKLIFASLISAFLLSISSLMAGSAYAESGHGRGRDFEMETFGDFLDDHRSHSHEFELRNKHGLNHRQVEFEDDFGRNFQQLGGREDEARGREAEGESESTYLYPYTVLSLVFFV